MAVRAIGWVTPAAVVAVVVAHLAVALCVLCVSTVNFAVAVSHCHTVMLSHCQPLSFYADCTALARVPAVLPGSFADG